MNANRAVKGRSRKRVRVAANAWLVQHLRSLVTTFVHARRKPAAVVVSAGVIGIALALPSGLYLTLYNLNTVAARWGANPQISVFLDPAASLLRAGEVARQFEGDKRFTSVTLIDRAQALADFRESSGLAGMIDELPQNPLPHILVLDLAADVAGDVVGVALAEELRSLPDVSEAQLDITWVRRLQAITAATARVITVVAVILGFGVVLIVGNTIRIGIYGLSEEIEVARLFGATDAFIRRPFLYSGSFQGLSGGLVACAIVLFCTTALRGPIDRLSALYASTFTLQGLSAKGIAVMLAVGAALGWGGAWLAVTMYLRETDITRD